MKFKYIYSFEQERMKSFWNYEIRKIILRPPTLFENTILIPATKKDSNLLFGEGGVINQDGNPIEDSFIKKGKKNEISFGITKNFSTNINIEKLDDEYIYLGYINNHWGHFIVDFSTRLYFAKKYPTRKFIFLVDSKEVKFSLIPQIRRFIELLGIDLKNISFINKITKVKKLIIPVQSYHAEVYYSDEYIEIFNTVIDKIQPTYNNKFKKVYFSRVKINNLIAREIGIEKLDDIFSTNNYNIFYPENELLDNQIYILNNCVEFCAVIGSILHNIMFIKNSNINIFCINKTYLNNTLIRDTCKIRNIDIILIDAYISKAPVTYGCGPFLIELNDNLKNFFYDKGIQYKEDKYNTKTKNFNNISKYNLLYYFFYYYKKRKIFFDENPLGCSYFSAIHFETYIKKYAKYELFPLNLYTIIYIVHMLMVKIKRKIKTFLKNLISKF